MPTLLISVPLGVRYLATVIARPEPSESPTVVCTRPLPNVASSPTTTALLLSLSAPDRTSDALAVPLSTMTAMGTLSPRPHLPWYCGPLPLCPERRQVRDVD